MITQREKDRRRLEIQKVKKKDKTEKENGKKAGQKGEFKYRKLKREKFETDRQKDNRNTES